MLREKISQIVSAVAGIVAEISVPEVSEHGHYATNVALRLAKERKQNPLQVAEEIRQEIIARAPADLFAKIEVAPPGFINFWVAPVALEQAFAELTADPKHGLGGGSRQGQLVMVEYTDPNPFKLFHIGHLMTNAIGEALAHLFEKLGAKVIRANYQGDVGLHVAMAVWGMKQLADKTPAQTDDVSVKTKFLGEAYAFGAQAHKGQAEAKSQIETINKEVFERSNPETNNLYDLGRQWSLEYFETIYKRLGTKFDRYFFESEVGPEGLETIQAHPEVFKESEGAVIFPGEEHGLHTRVFVNSQGLPTYEAKELGLNRKKFELYPLDLSVIVTGNEINDYFRVLLRAMELVLPEVAAKTKHIGHGFLRLPSGKMSSRTGQVITAESLIDDVKDSLRERASARPSLSSADQENVVEACAIGAIKYSILKQNPGQDIIFDFDRSLSLEGDSGPYLQYTYARLRSIIRKSQVKSQKSKVIRLETELEQALVRKMLDFGTGVKMAAENYAPNMLCLYLYELANLANKFYEATPILKDENADRRGVRLELVQTVGEILKEGMGVLAIPAPEEI